MIDQTKKWINDYYSWLKDNTVINQLNSQWVEINTPFLDRHNDGISLYVSEKNGKIIISDDGYTISDLELCGLNLSTSARQELLLNFIRQLGVSLDSQNNELFIEADSSNFSQKKHCLIQTILSVNDMFILSKNNVKNIFLEDVEKFFDIKDIRYTPNIQILGKSGMSHKIDFIIPKSKNAPERFIKAINTATTINAKSTLFEWQDISPQRKKDSLLYIFINDIDKKTSKEAINAFIKYNATPILWSKKDNYLKKLIA